MYDHVLYMYCFLSAVFENFVIRLVRAWLPYPIVSWVVDSIADSTIVAGHVYFVL